MSMLSDLLSKAQQLELELEKFAHGELATVKDMAKELRQNLQHEVSKEATATPQAPPANSATGVQTTADLL